MVMALAQPVAPFPSPRATVPSGYGYTLTMVLPPQPPFPAVTCVTSGYRPRVLGKN